MEERIVNIGSHRFTEVVCTDEPGAGGACHQYHVCAAKSTQEAAKATAGHVVFASVFFQNGPVKENGVNGCHQEDLLAIVIDRLQHFQKGPFACRENALALTKIEEAMHWLNHRTAQRQARGVEGTTQK